MVTVMAEKKMMTVEGLKKLEDELHERKVIIRKEIADKIKEAREQGDNSVMVFHCGNTNSSKLVFCKMSNQKIII